MRSRTWTWATWAAAAAATLAAGTAPAAEPAGRPLRRQIRFVGPIAPAWREVLAHHHVRVRGYIPEHTLSVMVDEGELSLVAHLPFVAEVRPEAAAEPAAAPSASRLVATVASRWAVTVLDPEDAAAVGALVASLGGALMPPAEGLAASATVLDVSLTPEAAARLAADERVEQVEPVEPMRLHNDRAAGVVQSGITSDKSIWAHGLTGRGEVVGACDVGIFAQSCFFAGDKIVGQQVLYPGVHSHEHGTHTAASIAGDQLANGIGDRYDGMAPAARLFIQDAGTAGTGDLSVPSDLSTLLEPAYRAGVRIHSDSWGGESHGYGAKERSLDAYVAAHPDLLVVLAAGNAGSLGSVAAPATAKNVLVVGAIDSSDLQTVASFTSRGPTLDGRIRPTLLAPGVNVVSASATEACGTHVLSGTSMAAPIAAGAAALARQYYREGFYPDGVANAAHALAPSAALLKATLLAGADPLGDGSRSSESRAQAPSNGPGHGRLHLDNALYFAADSGQRGAADGHRLWVLDDAHGLEQQQVFSTQITIGEGAMRVALAWSDQPAMAGARTTLVNDLDLELVDPSGNVRWGNAADFVGGRETTADHLNNEETLVVPGLPAGTYTVRVHAWNVPLGPQPFALVVVAPLVGAAQAVAGITTDADGQRATSLHADATHGCTALAGSDAGVLAGLVGLVPLLRRRGRT